MLDQPITRRPLFSEEHQIFRDQLRAFLSREVIPHHDRWEREGQVSREAWAKAGEAGILCPTVAEADGGLGLDFRFSAVIIEELARANLSGPGFMIHSEMVAPYIARFGTPEQKQRWLPGMVSGAVIGAIAMTEPGAGSDLRGMKTHARREGDAWVVNGSKVFISNGQLADLVVLSAKTEGDRISLFLVDTTVPGFRRGRNLQKMGCHAQDTSELFFDDMRLPADAVLGGVGQGFSCLMAGLARERTALAIGCVAKAEGIFDLTLAHARDRRMFGKTLLDFQNTRFVLADVKTDLTVGRAYVDDVLRLYLDGALDGETAAMAKLWTTEMVFRTADRCLQLFGGWGYMEEYPISRAFTAARIERIAGGASEVMRDIIGRAL